MAKSKSKSKAKTATNSAAGSTSGDAGISSVVVGDDNFFTAALSMIPAKHYLPAADDAAPQNNRFHARKDKNAAPPSRAEKLKAQRAKLDPKQAKSIPELLKERAAKEAKEAASFKASLIKPHHSQAEANAIEDAHDDAQMRVVSSSAKSSSGTSLTDDREELKQRLHKQLEALRAKRKARDFDDDDATVDAENPKKRRRLTSKDTAGTIKKQQNKRHKKGSQTGHDDSDEHGGSDTEAAHNDDDDDEDHAGKRSKHSNDEKYDRNTKAQLSKILQQAQARASPTLGASSTKGHQRDAEEADEADDLQFGTFDLSGNKPVPSYLANRKRKESDFQILQKAEKERRLLQELKQTDRGKEVAKDLLFEKALKKAKGEKVKDDVNKIKKTIKRKQSSKAKSQKEWKDRISTLKERQDAKQRRREENIKKYRGKNKAKNSKGGSKGGAKKGGRPGFEGKKGGFLNNK